MKTLENQTLLYDEDCPLCNFYTTGFIKTEMLDQNGRKPFSDLTLDEQNFIDIHRASNEIALVDNKNKTVIYGIDSLLKVIGNSFPWMEKVGNIAAIKSFLKKLYSFVSYNRKVIIPNKIEHGKALQCVPSFNYKYRIFYIVFATLITSFALYSFSKLVSNVPTATFSVGIILALSQIAFQSLFLIKFDNKTMLNYVGNLMTVSLFGSLLLTPILLMNQFVNIPETFILGWFAITVFIMFLEHSRRVKLLELPKYLGYTWIIYHIFAFWIISNV